MRNFKPNHTFIKLTNLLKNGATVRNRCTVCCVASGTPHSIDYKYRNSPVNLKQSSLEYLNPIITRYFSSNNNKMETEEKPTKKSIFKRFKEMYRDYWYVLIPVHLVTSAVWAGGFYYLATSGVDIPSLLEAMNCSEKIVNSMRNSSMGYWAITYGLYKIATPARYAVTIGGTTLSIQYLKRVGYIKPTAELKEMYREKKQNMIDHKENIMEKVSDLRDKKDKFVERVKVTQKGIQDKKDSLFGKAQSAQDDSKKVESAKNDKS